MVPNCSFVRCVCLALSCVFFVTPVQAWWSDEHQVITLIAEERLTEHSRQQIKDLIGDNSLSSLSLWADQIKSQPSWSHTRSWHYVNLELSQSFSSFQPKVQGDVLWALTHFYKQLSDRYLSIERRRQALLFFIHFAADIHQPLHVGTRADRGGNRVPVVWNKKARSYNLHQVWDGLLTKSKLSNRENAQRLLKAVSQQSIDQWQNNSYTDWAQESQQLLNSVYTFSDYTETDGVPYLDDQYVRANRPLAEKRLVQAGIRIAYALNQAFAKESH